MELKTNCNHCHKIFLVDKRRFNQNTKRGFKIYCSKVCCSESKRKRIVKSCFTCGKDVVRTPSGMVKSKSGKVFCSKSCSTSFTNSMYKKGKNHPNYVHGKSSYRKNKLRNSKNKCEDCGIEDVRVLQIHHLDGNRKNNEDYNLSILCANCHLIRHYESK